VSITVRRLRLGWTGAGWGSGVGFNIGISLLGRIEILTNNFNAAHTLDGTAGSAKVWIGFGQ
jgi:hypothetical protein